MTMDGVQDLLLTLVIEHAQFATVCTEPSMIALAAAKCRDLLGTLPQRIEVRVSPGILKNALSAGLPCGDRKGPDVSAALGAVIGDDSKGLQILDNVSSEHLESAYSMVDENMVCVSWDEEATGVYACVTCYANGHEAKVIIEGSHTNVTFMSFDGEEVFKSGSDSNASPLRRLREVSFEDLYSACMKTDIEDIRFLLEGAKSDLELSFQAQTAEKQKHSLMGPAEKIRSSPDKVASSVSSGCVFSSVYHKVLLAISARMGGTPWPVLTSGGSGNQGIMLAIPVVSVCEVLGLDSEEATRALYLGHAVNLYIKSYMGSISCVCGAVSAGAGVAAAASWCLSRDMRQVEQSIIMVLSALYGMLCDGAKASCALKGSIGAIQGLNAAFMVYKGVTIPEGEGIVGSSIEETLDNVGYFSEKIFSYGDKIMLSKMFE